MCISIQLWINEAQQLQEQITWVLMFAPDSQRCLSSMWPSDTAMGSMNTSDGISARP